MNRRATSQTLGSAGPLQATGMRISTKAASKPISAEMGPEAVSHLRRNFWLGILNGVGYNLYLAVLSTDLVLTWFLSELTASNLLISLLVPIELGSWYFLQLLLSGYIQGQPRVLPLYRTMGVVRLLALALLTAAVFALDSPQTLLVVFLVLFTASSVATGVSGLPFLSVIAKTIPARRRGMFLAWRRFSGGLLALLGGALVKVVLSPAFPLTFPDNYALLFLLGFGFAVVIVVSFSLIAEPAEAVGSGSVRLMEQLRRAVRLPGRDHSYRRYLCLHAAIVAASFSSPFYAVYARRGLNAPGDTVGIYLIATTLAGVLFNLVSGQISDRLGTLVVMRLAALTAALPAVMALFVGSLPGIGLDKSLVFALVFVFLGLHTTTMNIGSINYMLELAPGTDRAIYVGFANGVVGLTLFALPLGGVIADGLGFEALFLFSLAFALLAVFFSLGLKEPRRNALAGV